jgi:hypothetical protein
MRKNYHALRFNSWAGEAGLKIKPERLKINYRKVVLAGNRGHPGTIG